MTPDRAGEVRLSALLDRRSWIELTAAFVLISALFGLLSFDVVQDATDDPGYSSHTLLIGAAIGILIGLAVTGVIQWSWRRGLGRPAQRLGRRAWREGRLPATEPDRSLAIADLHRRENTAVNGFPPAVFLGIWVVLGGVQIATSHSVVHTTAWAVYTAIVLGAGTRAILDRRRLPRLRELLDRADRDRGQTTPAARGPAMSETGTDVPKTHP